MPRLYDVQLWKFPGVDTDTVTSSKRYALERAETLNRQRPTNHWRAIVVDFNGRLVEAD